MSGREQPELTETELWGRSINKDVAKEAISHAEKALSDEIDTKKSFDQKAATFFGPYITVVIALSGAYYYFMKEGKAGPALIAAISAVPFIGGVFALIMSLWPGIYGNLGSSPTIWLRQGIIDGQDEVLPKMLSKVLSGYSRKCVASRRANQDKAYWHKVAMTCGAAGALTALLGFIIVL